MDIFTSWVSIFFSTLSYEVLGQILSLGILCSIGISMYKVHTSENNDFNLVDLFVDSKTNKIDGSKFRLIFAFGITSWVLIYTTLNHQLSEWLFAGYIVAWVADRKFSRDNSSEAASTSTDNSIQSPK